VSKTPLVRNQSFILFLTQDGQLIHTLDPTDPHTTQTPVAKKSNTKIIVGSTLGVAASLSILALGIWWFYNKKRSKLAENKLSEFEETKVEETSEVNTPQLSSHAPAYELESETRVIAYELESKSGAVELQGDR
jgi:uncharacterized protein HemX